MITIHPAPQITNPAATMPKVDVETDDSAAGLFPDFADFEEPLLDADFDDMTFQSC